MQLSTRFSVRTLLIIVAVVALTFGIATELQNRQGRDKNAEAETRNRNQAAWHQEQADLCQKSLAQGLPYSAKIRGQLIRRPARELGIRLSDISLSGWASEATSHRYQAETLNTAADDCSIKKQYFQRRLLWPH